MGPRHAVPEAVLLHGQLSGASNFSISPLKPADSQNIIDVQSTRAMICVGRLQKANSNHRNVYTAISGSYPRTNVLFGR